jgi:hypothetical protein
MVRKLLVFLLHVSVFVLDWCFIFMFDMLLISYYFLNKVSVMQRDGKDLVYGV